MEENSELRTQNSELKGKCTNGFARHSFIFLALTLVFNSTAWVQSPPAAKTSVLLITVDTLRADRLGCYGAGRVATPAMDALAAEGVRFEHAYAQVPITLPSHAVILTGTYPMYNGVRDFTSHGIPAGVGLMAEAFKRQGYQTAGFVSSFVLDSTWGFGRGFETYDDHFDPRQFETLSPGNIQRRASETVDRLLAWLRARPEGASEARPFFVWLHLYDPHSSYNPPEPFRTRYAGRLYDGEVAYTDSQLARLFSELRKTGTYDRALIVLLSDHGESLGEHGEDEHGFFIYNSTLHVPMIFKLPRGQSSARVVQQPVGTIDVAPTLLELLRLRDPLSRQFQGSSLASLILGKVPLSDRVVYSESYYPRDSFGWAPLSSIANGRVRYIEAPRPEIYDLTQDAGETRNLIGQRRADSEALRAELQNFERRYGAKVETARGPALSTETLEKLKSLGYVAYSAPAPASPGEDLADPKDKISTLRQILTAADQTRLRRFSEADRLLSEIAGSEPELYVVPFQRGENFLAWKKPDRAIAEFKKSLSRNPAFVQAALGLGRAHFLLGQDEQAALALQVALDLSPDDFRAHLALSKVYWRQNLLEKARLEAETAIKIHSGFAESYATHGIILAKLGNYAPAAEELARGIGLGYRDAIAYNYLGVSKAQLGKQQDAIAAYEQAVVLDSKYPAAHLNLALQYKRAGHLEKARSHYQTLCALNADLCRQYAPQFVPNP